MLMARRQNATRNLVEGQLMEAGLPLNVVVKSYSTHLMGRSVNDGAGYVNSPIFLYCPRFESGSDCGERLLKALASNDRLSAEESVLSPARWVN